MPAAVTEPYSGLRQWLAQAGEAAAQIGAEPSAEPDSGRLASLYAQVEDLVLDTVSELPAGVEDYDARRLLEYLVQLRRAVADEGAVGDRPGRARLAAARMVDVARRLSRRLEHTAMEAPRVAADYLLDQLCTVDQASIGRLLGVSSRTVASWQRGQPVRANSSRVVLVAQLLHYLRPSLTPRGVLAWFDSESSRLGGRSPLAVLDEPDARARVALLPFARGARGQLAD